jgi:hypothetical protein
MGQLMAVLHITYKSNPDNADAADEGFCNVLKSYRSIRRLNQLAINTDEPPKAVWQKLTRYTEPDEYLLMFPLDARLWTSEDRKALQWILSRP